VENICLPDGLELNDIDPLNITLPFSNQELNLCATPPFLDVDAFQFISPGNFILTIELTSSDASEIDLLLFLDGDVFFGGLVDPTTRRLQIGITEGQFGVVEVALIDPDFLVPPGYAISFDISTTFAVPSNMPIPSTTIRGLITKKNITNILHMEEEVIRHDVRHSLILLQSMRDLLAIESKLSGCNENERNYFMKGKTTIFNRLWIDHCGLKPR
jgi:hypothetical protein